MPAWNPARLKKVPYHWNDIIPLFEREVALLRQTFDPSVPPASTAPDLPGLAGLLYGDPGLRRVKAADPITALALHWPDDDPERGRGWSAEWHGFLIWPREGRVTLRVHSDQSVRLEVRGETLLDGTGFPGTREVSISAGKGETVSLTLTYDHPSGSHSFLDIQWDGSGSGFSTVPATALRHSEKDARWASSAVVMSEL